MEVLWDVLPRVRWVLPGSRASLALGPCLHCDPDCPVQTPFRASRPKWEKMAEKSILAAPGTRGKNGRNIGQTWVKKWPFSHFSAIFSPFFPDGAKIHFSAIFFPFRAGGPKWMGSVQGNRDRNTCSSSETPTCLEQPGWSQT